MSKLATYEEFYRIISQAILKLPVNLEESSNTDEGTIRNLRLINEFEILTESLTIALNEFDGKTCRS